MDFAAMLREAREQEKAKKHSASASSSSSSSSFSSTTTTTHTSITTSSSLQETKHTSWDTLQIKLSDPKQIMDLSEYQVGHLSKAYYIPDWLSLDDETKLLNHVHNTPKQHWVQLRGRRLQNHGGMVRENMTHEALPAWLTMVCDRVAESGVFSKATPPNHVLLNEYQPGEGIMAHKDGPLYLNWVVIISLGSNSGFDFVSKPSADPELSIYLQRRSLFIFSEDLFTKWLHTVPERKSDFVPLSTTSELVSSSPDVDRIEESKSAREQGPRALKASVECPRDVRVSLTIRHVLV